jgi:hypothetical protein
MLDGVSIRRTLSQSFSLRGSLITHRLNSRPASALYRSETSTRSDEIGDIPRSLAWSILPPEFDARRIEECPQFPPGMELFSQRGATS